MITLTREEQKSVVKMVIESHQGITLSEAKTNEDIREEMKLNLEFYNSLKEGFTREGKTTLDEAADMFGTVLSVLGNIKDYLTGLKVIKNITAWVQELIQKLSEKLGPQIDKFIPQKIQDLAKDGVTAVEKFIKWLYNTLSYKGFAKLFAMIRYKTIKPSDEQKQCMELAAKKVYKWILITLVVAFVIKLLITAIPIIASAGVGGAIAGKASVGAVAGKASVGAAAKKASAGAVAEKVAAFKTTLKVVLKPVDKILTKIGHGSLFMGMYSTISAGVKTKDAHEISNDIKTIEQKTKDKEIDGFKDAWNYCPIK